MDNLTSLYNQFLNYFPPILHPVISIIVAAFLIYSIFQVLKKNFIWLILLIVLLPASVPIIKQVVNVLVSIIKLLLGQ